MVVVKFSVEGKIIQHQLCEVLHISDAPNCLLSISRLDNSGGHVDFQEGGCRLFDVKNQVIGVTALLSPSHVPVLSS